MVYEKMTKAELIRQLKTLQARSESTSTADESQHLLQELQIHQAELEAQNRELREAQQQLETSRDGYTDLYDFAPICYVSLDEKVVIQDINLTGAALLGLERSRLLGQPFIHYLAKGDLQTFLSHLKQCRQTRETLTTEVRLVVKDGGSILAQVLCVAVEDEESQTIAYRIAITDITERKRAEAALRESEERFRMIADSAPVLIWVNNTTGCEFVNYEYLEFLGVGEGEVLGYGWAQFIHPEDREDCVNAYLEAVSRRGRFEADFRFRRRDGDYRWMRSVGIPRYQGCEFKGYVGITYDIHERKRAEDAIRAAYEQESEARALAEVANRSKDEFLAVVSHELRSPLNAILGYNSLLRESPPDPAQLKRDCDIIERNARTQLKLIEDLLDTARIVSGKLRLELRPLDIYPVLADALDMVRPAAEAKGIQLRIGTLGLRIEDYAAREDPTIVLGDAARLQQIVWNLLSNAIKFTPAGGRVELRAERAQEGVRIMVSDTGGGIQPEFLPHVFDRFRQADSSSTKRYGGLGLGLALVKHLAEMHGGKVEAASAGAGRGATFTVTLPLVTQRELVAAEPLALAGSADLVAGAASEAQTEDEIPFPAGVTIAGVRVLVVDDQEEVRVTLADFLNRRGAVVTTASSSAEALAVLSYPPGGAKPDILVCDIMMPEEDGYAMLRRLRALEAKRGVAKSQQIPAIALTALTGDEDRLRALSAGFQSHIAKPAEPDELMLVIANIAGLWRQGAAFNKPGQ